MLVRRVYGLSLVCIIISSIKTYIHKVFGLCLGLICENFISQLEMLKRACPACLFQNLFMSGLFKICRLKVCSS